MQRHRIDKAALRETIASLGGLTSEQKADLLQILSEQKRYGLVWEEHTEEVEEQLRTQLPVLTEDATKRIVSTDETAPNHVIIEGDNLHALTALAYTHEGRVDVIYIDPPYNTGNKDFVYNDSFVDSEDGYRHSKWLSFMHKRLKIAKRLLSDRGVIFISIDDNEQANLKLLCDEVFGSGNFLANIVWEKRFTRSNNSKRFATLTEPVLCYSKHYISLIKEKRNEKADSIYSNPDNDPRGVWTSVSYVNPAKKEQRPNLVYPLINPTNGKEVNHPTNAWKFEKATYEKHVAENRLWWGKKGENIYPRLKKFLSELGGGMVPVDLWKHEDAGSTDSASKELECILGKKLFDFPKPKELIMKALSLTINENDNKEAIILDFFAGSGTTLHATMQLNAEDGGHRQCILVTNNENGICENVTYERNRRVIQGYTTPKGVEVMGLSRNNLRYYRTDFVERETTRTAQRQLMMASTELLCIKHNVYDEQRTFGHITLRPTTARFFADGEQQMLIVYRTEAIESLVAEIAQMPESTRIIVYVFSINNYAMDADFEEVSDKVTLCALPAAIYNAYLQVLPKRRMPKDENENHGGPQA